MEIKSMEDLRKMTKEQLINESIGLAKELESSRSESAGLRQAYLQQNDRYACDVDRKNAEIDALILAIRKICRDQ